MRSATSFFDLTLYRKDLARFWPLWTLYTVVWLFILPIPLINRVLYSSTADLIKWTAKSPVIVVGGGNGLFLAVCVGVLAAMAVWSYLYNNRSANMMHALPVRREGHFLTHWLSGVTMFLLPHVIVFVVMLLTMALCGAFSGAAVGNLAAALGCQTLLCLFFFCFASFCAMLTGHTLVLPAFYGIFNLLVYVMSFLVDWLGTFFFYGYTGELSQTAAVKWLTPIYAIGDSFDYTYPTREVVEASGEVYFSRDTDALPYFEGVPVLAVYAAVGIVLAAIALLLYRKRHMETAGDVVAVLQLRPVFLYCVAFCTGLAGSCFTCEIFGLNNLTFLIFGLLFWGIVGYFAALMLLNKSFRVFKTGWRGCIGTAVVLLLLCGVMQLDLFGVETRVPDAEDVASVSIWGIDTQPNDDASYINIRGVEDPETIARAIAVHQAIVDSRDEREALERGSMYAAAYTAEAYELREQGLGVYASFDVTYTLKDGRTLERHYGTLWLEYGNLADPTSLEARMTELASDRTILASRYYISLLEEGTLTAATLNDDGLRLLTALYVNEGDFAFEPRYYFEEMEMTIEEAEKYGYGYYYYEDIEDARSVVVAEREVVGSLVEHQVTEQQAETLRQAILTDFYAGNLGVRCLFPGDPELERQVCVADLTFHFEYTRTEGTTTYIDVMERTIALTAQAENTIAALEAMGAFDEGGAELRTQAGELIVP